MGPPSLNGGNPPVGCQPVSDQGALQWGRRLSTAETGELLGCPVVDHMLQWGRRLSTAETGQCLDPLTVLIDWLQWGRRLSTAETPA